MAIYLFLDAVLIFFSIVTSRSNRKVVTPIYFLLCMFVVLLPAIRDISVGTDTINYVKFFINPNLGYDSREVDLGFQAWSFVLSSIWKDKDFFIFANAFASILGVFYIISKESPNRIFSLLLFVIVEQFYSLQFTAMRQTLSISLFLIALHFFNKGKNYWRLSAFIYLLSFFFHATVLWCLPVALIMYFINPNKIWLLGILAVSFIIGVSEILDYRNLISNFFRIIDPGSSVGRYGVYSTDVFGIVYSKYRLVSNALPLSLICAMCIIYSSNVNIFLLKFFFAGVVVNNLMVSDPIAFRLVIYPVMLVIIVLPLIFQNRKKVGFLLYSITVIYFCYKSYAILLAQKSPDFIGNKIIPYKTFFK